MIDLVKAKGKTVNIVGALLGIILSLAVWISASQFPPYSIQVVGPDYFPKMLSVGLGLSSLWLLIGTIRTQKDDEFPTMDIRDKGVQRVIIAFLATLLLALLMKRLGFIPSAILYMFGMMYLLENRKYLKMAIISVAAPIIVSVLFEKLLGILLPLGIIKNILY